MIAELLQDKRIGFVSRSEIDAAVVDALKLAQASFTGTEASALAPGSPELARYDALVLDIGDETPNGAGEQDWLRPEGLRKNTRPLLLAGAATVIREHLVLQSFADDLIFRPFVANELVFRLYRLTGGKSDRCAEAQRSRKPCVLVADDDPDIIIYLQGLLRSFDVEAHFVGDGKAALEAARKLLPDLVLLDVRMPMLSGIEVVRRLRGDPGTRGLVAVLLTASSDLADVKQSADLGVADYILKPFGHTNLIRRLRALLKLEPKTTPGAAR